MIKTKIATIVFLLSVGCSFGQHKAKEPSKQIGLQRETPVLNTEMQQYAVENGSYIVENTSSEKSIPIDGDVSFKTAQLVDPAKMKIAIIDRTQFFTITGTTQLLVVKSTWVLDNEMKTKK